MRIDIEGFRQKKCSQCEKYAGNKNLKLEFGKTYCLGTHEDIHKCVRMLNYKIKEE